MRKLLIVFAVLLSTGWTLGVTQAQDALTQSLTTSDGSFSLMYPQDWTATDLGGGEVSLVAGDSVTKGLIAFEHGSGTVAAKDVAANSLSLYPPEPASGTPGVTEVKVGDRTGYAADIQMFNSSAYVVFADFDNGMQFSLDFKGERAALNALKPTIGAILNSFKLGSASTETGAAATPSTVVVDDDTKFIIESNDRSLFMADPFGKVTPLTCPSNADFARLSPDGKTLAFVSYNPDDKKLHVYLADSNCANLRQLSQGGGNIQALAWSPDSKQLMFTVINIPSDSTMAGIYKINADGSGEAPLTLEGIDATTIQGLTLDWSPDGKRIVFGAAAQGSTVAGLFFAAADGSSVTPAPPLGYSGGRAFFRWSPDGEHALISSYNSLTVTRADGTDPQTVLDSSQKLLISEIAWSPDSQRFAFGAKSGSETASTLYIANLDGSNRQKVDFGQQAISAFGDYPGMSWGIIPAELLPGSAAAPTEAPTDAALAVATNTLPTASAGATSNCTLTTNGTANLRSGPGTSFAKAGSLAGGVTQTVTGKATGSDGKVWYQLDGGSYVRSDLVKVDGDCASVPTVSP